MNDVDQQNHNETVADRFGMSLLQAEVLFSIAQALGMEANGSVCYHGNVPSNSVMGRLLRMKQSGFMMSAKRMEGHFQLMAAHGLLHNTAKGDAHGTAYLQEQQAKKHGRIEDN